MFEYFAVLLLLFFCTPGIIDPRGYYYYYYFAAFNAPCVGHKDEESQCFQALAIGRPSPIVRSVSVVTCFRCGGIFKYTFVANEI